MRPRQPSGPIERQPSDRYPVDVPYWMSIEVFDGAYAASRWADAWGDSLSETAISHGATDWGWHPHSWGVIFEIAFSDEAEWERFRTSDALRAALDNTPDPSAVIVYRGRGGSAGTHEPRRPRPLIGSGAAALPLPFEPDELEWTIFGTGTDRRRLMLASR